MRYFIQFSYNGKNYFGYQIQPKEISVQEVIEKALSTLLKERVSIVGAGRTDTGVHAKNMYAHFDFEAALPHGFAERLNRFVPMDISVQRIFEVPLEAHARFDATYRTYEYKVSLNKDPFSLDQALQHYKRPLDVEKMNQAAKILLEYEDFESFAKVGADNKTFLCQVTEAQWRKEGELLIFRISANRFLRNMVRSIVGTLLEVGTGKREVEDLHPIIQKKDRGAAGTSAPAHGLSLIEVGYPEGIVPRG